MIKPNFNKSPIALCIVALSSGVFAQSNAVATLEPVTVIATKTPNSVDRTAASVSVAGEERLAETLAQTVLPVIQSMPNVEMAGGPRVDALIPTIRGVQGASITLLLDGARQNDTQGVGMKSPMYVDPYFLKQVEVLRGASSSLYGTGGNGGVMSLTTLSARDLLESGQKVGGGIKTGYVSADGSTHLNARVYGGNDSADALVALGRHNWNKIRQPDGSYLTPNDGSSDTGLIKLGMNPARNTRVELSHQFYDSQNLAVNNPLAYRYKRTTDAVNAAIPFIQPTLVNQSNTVLKASHGKLSDQEGMQIDGSVYQTRLKNRLDPYATNAEFGNAATTNISITGTETAGGNLQLIRQLGNHRVIVGGEAFTDKLSSLSGTTTLTPSAVNPDGKRDVTGLFVQDEWALGNGWKFIPTVRHDRYSASAVSGATPETTRSRVSPKATVVWDDGKNVMTYASYGEGFRAPTVGELFQNSTVGNFRHFLPNANLRPEIDKTTEVGVKTKHQGVFKDDDTLKFRAAVFESRLEDLINSAVLGNIAGQSNCYVTGLGCRTQYQNVGEASRTGAELEASYSQDLWQYSLGYGRVRLSNSSTGENLFSPPDKLTAQIRRAIPSMNLSVLWNSTFVAAQDYDSTALRRRDGYSVHDVYVRWLPSSAKYRVDAGVSNVFNRSYVVYQSSNLYAANTYQPGRSFLVSVSADF